MDDLTKIKGIGTATAKKLAAAGIETVKALAEADAARPIDGVAETDWAGWIAAAKAVLDAPAPETAPEAGADTATGQDGADATQSPVPPAQPETPAPPAAKPAAKPASKGPRCLTRVRYGGKTYEPDEYLPGDLPEAAIAQLKAAGAIAG